jgi:hydroxyacyl-ACP dehydratase HTD2-like protein with hotdog domain
MRALIDGHQANTGFEDTVPFRKVAWQAGGFCKEQPIQLKHIVSTAKQYKYFMGHLLLAISMTARCIIGLSKQCCQLHQDTPLTWIHHVT